MSLTWTGEVVDGAAATAVLDGMTILDKAFTKTTGVQSDGKNTIWLVEVEGHKVILKRTEQFYRSLRCQIFLDALKPWFGITPIGSVLLAPGGHTRPTLLMRFVGTGLSLMSIEQDDWLWDDRVFDALVRICLFDMVVANSSRKGRNILWGGPGVIVPIDEEQGMDFRITPEFRMNGAVRRRLTMVNLDPYLQEFGMDGVEDPEVWETCATGLMTQWRPIAERYYQPTHAHEIVDLMIANAMNMRRRFFKYLDTSYGASTRSGVVGRGKQGPRPWEKVP